MQIPIHTTNHASYVAFQIDRILMVNALGEYKQLFSKAPEYQSTMTIVQHVELVNSLLQSTDERFTYEMRIISQPNTDQPSQGRICVYCIIAMRDVSTHEAQEHVQRVFRLFNAHFRDVVWVTVADVAPLLTTGTARHAISLTRKSGFILSDRTDSTHPYGFVKRTSMLARTQMATNDRMFYISPFVSSGRQSHALFDYMLQHPHPITISMRIQRTQLTAEEVRFCQENLDTYSDTQKYPHAVASQLGQYQQIMNGALLRSYTAAALLNIDVVSPHFIPAPFITLMGNLITQPAGGLRGISSELQYHGGYDVIHHSDYLPVATAIATVCMRPIPASLTPALDRLPHVVDVNEAAVAFHIPRSSLTPVPGMIMQSHRQLRPPSDLSETGTVIGQYQDYGVTKPIYVSEIDRMRHTYIVGQTGTGKSTVLKSMVLDDIIKGRGVCVIDPHGDLFNDLLTQIPVERRDDVIVFDPTQTDAPIGLNIFEYDTQEEREMAVQLFQKTIELLEHGRQTHDEEMGPVFWQHLRNNAYWVTQDKHDPGTVIEMYNLFTIPEYYKRWQPINTHDDKLVSWEHILQTTDYNKADSDGIALSGYIISKFEDFIFDSRLRLIFGQKQSTFNFYDAMNTQKIVLINLSRGLLSEVASTFMGGVILAKLQQAALKRASLSVSQRPIFSIYVDEFQNYTSDSFVSLLSESRKYGIALTLANQFLDQIENERITQAIMGNVGTIIAFRVGIKDAEILHPRFAPEVEPSDLINLPNWHAYTSTQVHGQSRRPFSLQTIRPREVHDLHSQAAVIAQSKRRYGRLRSEVERMLTQSAAMTREVSNSNVLNQPTIQMNMFPVAHEIINLASPKETMIAVHGAGLSLWRTNSTSMVPLIIGIHEHLMRTILDAPIRNTPYMQYTDSRDQRAFLQWADANKVTTLHDALTILDQQQMTSALVNERNYTHNFIAFQMHQSRHDQQWQEVVLTKKIAVALDTQHQAWVWHNRPPARAEVVADVVAIAGSEHHAYLCKTDGTVVRYHNTGNEQVPNVHNIVKLNSGENFVVAVDASGQMHVIYEHDRFAERVDTIPSHSNIALVACGFDHVIAYDAHQRFITWGANDHKCRDVPSVLKNTQVVALAAGYDRSFALDANGKLYAWGNHQLSTSTLNTLNTRTVQTITCFRTHFLCQTADGTWWHNNQPLQIPATLAAQYITRIATNYSGDMLAIRAADPLVAILDLQHLALKECSDLDATIRAALNDVGIMTLAELFQQTYDQLRTVPLFQVQPSQLDTLVAYIHNKLVAHQLPLSWPTQPFDWRAIAPTPSQYGWYVRKPVAPTSSKQSSDDASFDFDDDFFNDL